jgi:hypothetical protein
MPNDATKTAVGAAVGSAAGVIAAELLKGQPAQAAGGPTTTTLSLDDATKALLQAIKKDSDNIISQLNQLLGIIGGKPVISRIADKFGYDNQILLPGAQFKILDEGSGEGSLIYLLVDVQSPNVIVNIILDNIQYDFDIAQMIQEGLMFPMYPGAWITRADPVGPPPTYCMLFSVGNLDGYPYKERINIAVTNNSGANMILNHSLGIKWFYQQ